MSYQILLNFLIAFLWMFLSASLDASTFLIGYFMGLIMLYFARRSFPSRFYVDRVWSIIKLFFLFLKELIAANIAVFRLVIRPKLVINPVIFALETKLRSDWEVTLLANLITLTPGTLTVDVSEDSRTLYIHAIDADDVEEAIDAIRESFERAIEEVSRK